MLQLCVIFIGSVYVDTVQAETLSQGQDALKRSQLQFYEAAKANPKATREELVKIRDRTQGPGQAAWGRAVNGAISQAMGVRAKNAKLGSDAAGEGAGKTKLPAQPSARPPKTSSFGSTEPGISGSDVPSMLEFPGKKTK